MYLPINEALNENVTSTWKWLGLLPKERKWSPALGTINGQLVIAGGVKIHYNLIMYILIASVKVEMIMEMTPLQSMTISKMPGFQQEERGNC